MWGQAESGSYGALLRGAQFLQKCAPYGCTLSLTLVFSHYFAADVPVCHVIRKINSNQKPTGQVLNPVLSGTVCAVNFSLLISKMEATGSIKWNRVAVPLTTREE